MNKHTIGLLNDSFPPIVDGVANVVVNYGKIIEQNHGHSIVVTPDVPDADDTGYDFPIIRYPSIDTRKLVGYVTGYPFSPEAAHFLKDEHTELLHTHCPIMSCLLARQLAESMDLPLVLTWHTKYDIDIANAVKSKMLRDAALQALLNNVNACDEVWTVSRGAGENLRSIGYEGDYIVMPNGVDLSHMQSSEDIVHKETSGYDLPKNVPVFLFIGRLMWYKGLRIIIDALKKLEKREINFRMVFVGSGGDEAEVKAYVTELGLDKKVFFTGAIFSRERLRAWYTRANVFLFPSTFDTNGLVVREAAATNTASIIIKDSCASEGVTDGRNGFLIDENADALSSKLSELTSSPEKMTSVGMNAGNELYTSWEEAVAKAYERYEIVIDRHKSGYYQKRLPYDYDFFRAQGDLMETLGEIDAVRQNLFREAQTIRDGIDSSLRTIRNKAITDAITAGYETRLELQSIREEAETAFRDKKKEVLENIDTARKDFLDTLGRYL